MSFGLYLAGCVLVVGGVAWGMSAANVPPTWIGITCLILVGIGVLSAVKNERTRDK